MMMRHGDETWKALPIDKRPSFYALAKDDLTETSPYECDDGELIGRDPRSIPAETLAKYYSVEPGGAGNGRVVRAKCLDCCCYQESEVRKCTALACALWPYRMGTNPFSTRSKSMSEEAKAKVAERFALAREAKRAASDAVS